MVRPLPISLSPTPASPTPAKRDEFEVPEFAARSTSSAAPATMEGGEFPIANQTFTANLNQPPKSRIERVAEIIFVAACRVMASGPATAFPDAPKLPVSQERILKVIADLGSASPRQIQQLVELSRATVGRDLKVLRAAGRVESTGRTRHVRYCLPREQKNSRSMTQILHQTPHVQAPTDSNGNTLRKVPTA